MPKYPAVVWSPIQAWRLTVAAQWTLKRRDVYTATISVLHTTSRRYQHQNWSLDLESLHFCVLVCCAAREAKPRPLRLNSRRTASELVVRARTEPSLFCSSKTLCACADYSQLAQTHLCTLRLFLAGDFCNRATCCVKYYPPLQSSHQCSSHPPI